MSHPDILETHTFSREQRSRLYGEIERRFPDLARLSRNRLVALDDRVRELTYIVHEAMEVEAEKAVADGEPKWSAYAKARAFIDGMKPSVERAARRNDQRRPAKPQLVEPTGTDG